MTDTYSERKRISATGEQGLPALLEARGYHVQKFGQDLFSSKTVHFMKQLGQKNSHYELGCLLRWMPDFVVIKNNIVRLVDVKTSTYPDTYAIEENALIAYEGWEQFLYRNLFVPLAMVSTKDMKVWKTSTVRDFGTVGKHRRAGSGTPFFVLQKRYTMHFDDFFH